MIEQAERAGFPRRLLVFDLDRGDQIDALRCAAGTVGFIGQCDIALDHGTHEPVAALRSAYNRRIDNEHIDHAAVVGRRFGVRRERLVLPARRGLVRLLVGLPAGETLPEGRRARFPNYRGIAEGVDAVDGTGRPDHARHHVVVDGEHHSAMRPPFDVAGQRIAGSGAFGALEHPCERRVREQVQPSGGRALALHIQPQRRQPLGVHHGAPLPHRAGGAAFVGGKPESRGTRVAGR